MSILSRQHPFISSLAAADAMSNNWSGTYIRDNYGEAYTRIQGSWIVPRRITVILEAAGWRLAAWHDRRDCLAGIGRLRSGQPVDAADRDIPGGRL